MPQSVIYLQEHLRWFSSLCFPTLIPALSDTITPYMYRNLTQTKAYLGREYICRLDYVSMCVP